MNLPPCSFVYPFLALALALFASSVSCSNAVLCEELYCAAMRYGLVNGRAVHDRNPFDESPCGYSWNQDRLIGKRFIRLSFQRDLIAHDQNVKLLNDNEKAKDDRIEQYLALTHPDGHCPRSLVLTFNHRSYGLVAAIAASKRGRIQKFVFDHGEDKIVFGQESQIYQQRKIFSPEETFTYYEQSLGATNLYFVFYQDLGPVRPLFVLDHIPLAHKVRGLRIFDRVCQDSHFLIRLMQVLAYLEVSRKICFDSIDLNILHLLASVRDIRGNDREDAEVRRQALVKEALEYVTSFQELYDNGELPEMSTPLERLVAFCPELRSFLTHIPKYGDWRQELRNKQVVITEDSFMEPIYALDCNDAKIPHEFAIEGVEKPKVMFKLIAFIQFDFPILTTFEDGPKGTILVHYGLNGERKMLNMPYPSGSKSKLFRGMGMAFYIPLVSRFAQTKSAAATATIG